MYLTPDRLRTMGLGIDLEGVENVALRSAIVRASAAIDTYCAVPLVPSRYSFRGGTVVDEAKTWFIDPMERPHPYRFWPNFQPVREITSFRIYSTNDIYVDIPADNIFINNNEGYIEISSLNLTEFGIFGAGIVPLVGMFNPVAKSSYTYGYRFAVVDEVVEATDARTYSAMNQFWTADDVTVKVNDAVVASGFTIDRIEGRIVFASNQIPGAVVAVSYTHPVPSDVQSACGIILASDLGEADLRAKGMEGLAEIRVQDVALRREPRSQRSVHGIPPVPETAGMLLDPFVFVTLR